MERVNIVVLASLAAAVTMLGLRLLSRSAEPDFKPAPAVALGSAFNPDGVRDRKLPPSRIGIDGGSRHAADKPAPGATPAVEPPRRRSHAEGGDEGQSTELIA